jgi:hypothetical protein
MFRAATAVALNRLKFLQERRSTAQSNQDEAPLTAQLVSVGLVKSAHIQKK